MPTPPDQSAQAQRRASSHLRTSSAYLARGNHLLDPDLFCDRREPCAIEAGKPARPGRSSRKSKLFPATPDFYPVRSDFLSSQPQFLSSRGRFFIQPPPIFSQVGLTFLGDPEPARR